MRRLPLLALVLLLAATACSPGGAEKKAAAGTAAAPASVEPAPTPTDAPTTTTSHAPATTAKKSATPLPGLQRGSKGPEVLALEQKLATLKYDTGAVDGTFDSTTTQAVIAFQKVNGMARTGRATADVTAKLATAGAPAPLLPAAEATRVEIDLPRQVLFLYQGGQLVRTLAISSGGGYRYCVDGECAKAITPGGSFRVGRKILGKHISPLGELYNPLFFNGGIAIHGAPSVPASPASHGCVRIPMSASLWFYNTVASGTPVYVIGGPRAPVPFNTPAPDGTPPSSAPAPPPDSTTTTTAPPASTTTSTSTSTTSTTSTPSSTTSTTLP